MTPVRQEAKQRRHEDLGHRDTGHGLDVELADPQERRHVEQKRNHDQRPADAEEPGEKRAQEADAEQRGRERKRHAFRLARPGAISAVT